MGAITLDEYKKILKEKSQQPQTNNTGTVTNQRVTVPNTISFNDYKSKYSPQLPTQATLSGNTVLLPTMENKVQPEQYVDTGKKYGDYFYQDYATRKNDKIYSKGGKYYVFNSKTNQYEDIDSSSKSTITTVEEKNRRKEEAKKLGYKDYYEEQDKKIKKLEDKYNSLNKKYDDNINIYTAPEKVRLAKEISKAKKEFEQAEKNNKYLSVSDRINLDTGNLTKKEYKEYSEDLQRQREKIENEQAEKRRVKYSGTGVDALKEIGTKAEDIAYPINKEVIEPIKYAKENYDIGKQNNKLAIEYYKKMEGKENNAEKLENKINKFNRYNQDLITKPGAAGTSIQNMNTQVESLKRSWWAALPGAAIGGVGGFFGGGPVGAVAGAKKGFDAGYTLGSAPYTYKLEAGNTYKELTEQGIPKNIAKDLARKTGVINAAIESGEKVLDIITWGRAGKLKDASEQMLYDELKKEYGEKALKTFLVKAGYSYAQNVASESMEEMAQEGTSILAEREAYKKAGMDRQVTDEEDIKRILAAGKSAAISTAFTAPLTAGAGTISQSVFNNLRTQAINNVNTLTNTDINTEITNQIINYSKENNTNLTEGEVLQIKENVKNNLEQNNVTVIDNQNNVEQTNLTQQEIKQKIKDLTLELKSYEQVSQDGTFVGATDEVITELRNEINNLQQQLKNQPNIPTVEDIVNQERNKNNNPTMQELQQEGFKYSNSTNLSFDSQLDLWSNNQWNSNTNMVMLKNTPKIYLDAGLKENAITITPSKMKEIVYGNKNHIGIGLENAKKLPQQIANPLNIIESTTKKNSIVIATELSDANNNMVIAAMAINGYGRLELLDIYDKKTIKKITSNAVSSAYGKDNYDSWISRNKDKIIYDIDDGIIKKRINGEWVQSPNDINSFAEELTPSAYGNNIPQVDKNVKLLPTNNDMQKVENNTINLPTNEDINLRSLEEIAPEVDKNDLGYIPQDPTRESSYDNDAPNFWELDNNKDSLSDPITEFARALDREIEENTKTPKQIKETNNLKSKAETMLSDLQEKFVNRNYEIDKLAKKSGNMEIKFKGDMLNSVAGETSGDINVAQTDNYGRRIGPSIRELFKNAKEKGYYEQLDDYLKHYSNIDRHAYGKGSVVPLEYSQKMVKAYEQSVPGIKNDAEKVWKYNKNILKNLEENGLETKGGRETLESLYPHYVPYIQADYEALIPYMDDSGEVKPNQVIKRAKGGANNLITIEEAMEKYTYAEKKAIRKNDLFKEIVKSSKEKVSIGADDRIDATQLDGSLMVDEEGNKIVTAYVDGMQQQAKVNDNLYKELTKENELKVKETEAKYSLIVKPLQKISEIRRNILTTWNPGFILTNPIKDIQDGMFNSKYTKDFVKHLPTSFYELATQNTETAQQFASLYGSGMVMGDYQIDSLSKASKNMDIKQLNKLIKTIPNANEIVELAPRYAEFKASLENGCSVTEAMYNAREITTNFNRGGYITKALNRDGFTFLNASVQGFDKLIRNLTGQNGSKGVAVGVAGIMTKVAVLGIAPAMFNAMAFGEGEDDEDEAYKALPDYIKDNYYLFKIKGIKAKNSKYYDGEFLRIPKGRVLSIFGSAARRTLEYSKGDKNAFDGYLKNVESQVGINNPEENNIIAPLKQAFGSKNGEAWYGGDLVPKRLQNKPVAEQYDEGTDEFSKWLGKMINVSPYKINYLLDQYSGGAGDIVLPMITKETTNGATTTKDYLIAPIKDKFIVNSTDDNKYASKFYTKLEKLQTKSNSYNVSENDKLKYKYMNSISSDMSKLYKEKREVQLDDSLTKKQKYKKVQSIQKEINRLAEEGIKEPKIKDLKSHYVKVENTEYYKNSKGSWTNIKEEEASELKGLRMSANEKSNYFKTKNKIGAIRSSDLDSSVKKDKISNLIINMNMSDDKLAYLYGKYYSNEKTLDMIQDAGISMKEFIKYNNQKFESDYYTNGKTVKNSKLAKTINYVNTLNLNVAQKAILIKMKNNSYKQYDKQIVEYLNTKNISYLDKAAILKKIGFKAYDKQIISRINSMNISKEEKIKMLKEMGFTIRNGRVYS